MLSAAANVASVYSQIGQEPTQLGQVHKGVQAVVWEISTEPDHQRAQHLAAIHASQQALLGNNSLSYSAHLCETVWKIKHTWSPGLEYFPGQG